VKGKLKIKRLRDKRLKQDPRNKARRKINLSKRGQYVSRRETQEGETYRSGMAFDEPHSDTLQPKVWKSPPFIGTLPRKLVNGNLIYFDLETSGLSTAESEILQISAKSNKGDFNIYCTPVKPISYSASQTNMLTVQNGVLKHKATLCFPFQ
jgi:uncharacterized protein YprB with RNaseH-like and TPR domain